MTAPTLWHLLPSQNSLLPLLSRDPQARHHDPLFAAFAAGEDMGYYIHPWASVALMRIDPIWDPIRDHPAFHALLEQYGPLK